MLLATGMIMMDVAASDWQTALQAADAALTNALAPSLHMYFHVTGIGIYLLCIPSLFTFTMDSSATVNHDHL